jgi:hypothetical protein
MDRTRLHHGPYRQPRYRPGGVLFCEVRGEVVICGVSAGPIPWPVGKRGRARSLVVTGGLARAVRRESAAAVCHGWGVTAQTVSKWRKALSVPQYNEGTTRLHSELAPLGVARPDVQDKARAAANTPEANRKKAGAKVGQPRPEHVRAVFNFRGRRHSEATKAKMRAAARKRLEAAQ